MATLESAEAARRVHAARLRRVGAHAIEVGKTERKGRTTFAVIAHFDRMPPKDADKTLEVQMGHRRMRVPLVIRIAPEFRLE
jgi:hypothetical protein